MRQRHYLTYSLAAGVTAGVVVGVTGVAAGAKVQRVQGDRAWRKRSWVHLCLGDEHCDEHGETQRIYAFGWVLTFPDQGADGELFDVFDVDED